MKALSIIPTDTTPKIFFDPENNNFEISGHSRPEDVRTFYRPVLKWIKEFAIELSSIAEKPSEPLSFNFIMEYFNSSSAKFLLDVIVEINKIHNNGNDVHINWRYEEGDDDMREVGEDLSDMVDFTFKYISYELPK